MRVKVRLDSQWVSRIQLTNPATLPDSVVKETAPDADPYPSTTEFSAEESATSTAAATGAVAPTATLAERPKTSEPIAAPVDAAVVTPTETEAAHVKRPYEKPIFSNEENLKPNKIPKTEEEQAADIKAQTAQTGGTAFKAPEPALKQAEETAPVQPAPKTTEGTTQASPVAVAAANAAITSSRADKSAAPAAPAATTAEAEPKKPEPAVQRGEEPQSTETPKETAPNTQEPAKTEERQASEPSAEQAEKKKGGFFSRLKRMFK